MLDWSIVIYTVHGLFDVSAHLFGKVSYEVN